MTRSTAGIAAAVCAVLVATIVLPVSPVRAQHPGQMWDSLVPRLKAQLASKPDPEVALRLALVYAHDGALIDWWHTLKQIDQMIGGDGHREAVARRASARAAGEVLQDPHNLLARYELAFASWFTEDDHHTALQELREITRQEPRNPINHGYLGYVYADRKDTRNTIAQWEEGVRLDPNNNAIRYLLGMAYSHVGRTRDAAVQFALAYRDRTVYNYVTRGEQP
ncbi:MAG TPA: hypothetical protein VGA35_00910 [bacterium]